MIDDKEEIMKKRINFWVIRHGERNGNKDALSEKGVQQVKRVTSLLMQNFVFSKAFYSGMNRTKQTVETMLEVLGSPLKATREEGFGYEWAEKEQPLTPEMRKAAAEGKEEMTAADWLRAWPGALLIRGRFLATMLGWARTLAGRFSKKEIDVLVGSHGPTGELAALKPEATRALGLAEIICYVIEYDEETDEAKLVASARLRNY